MSRFRALLPTLVLLLAADPGAGAGLEERLAAAVEAALPAALEARHAIHRNPELGYEEHETAALVAGRMRELGYEVTTGVAHTGVVAVLRGGRPGAVVAVRADMDALPVTEATDLPFRSEKRGTFRGQEVGLAHACGHDVHTAVGLGVAEVLAGLADELPGTVKFLFQPAEEGPPPGELPGAALMLEEGALDDPRPEAIFALHAFPDLEVGQVGYLEGPAFAAVDQFEIRLVGRQAHGAFPHLAVDPIVMAAQVVEALQTIRSRTLPPREASVLSIGVIRGGERFNIIPAEVVLEGTVRTYRPEARQTVERRMREILDGVSRAAGGTFELDYRNNAPATVNDPELARRSRPSLAAAAGRENVVDVEPTMGGEDFAFFAQRIPGFYYRLGVSSPEHPSGGLHTPTFRAADGAVAVGVATMSRLVIDYLGAAR